MVGHRPVLDDFGRIVVFESQWIFGGGAFVGDFANFGKCGLHKSTVATLGRLTKRTLSKRSNSESVSVGLPGIARLTILDSLNATLKNL